MSNNFSTGEGPKDSLQPSDPSSKKERKKYANLTKGPAADYLAEHVRQWNAGEIPRIKSIRALHDYLLRIHEMDASPSGIAKCLIALEVDRSRSATPSKGEAE